MEAAAPTGPPSLRMLKIDDEFSLVPPKAKVKDAANILLQNPEQTIIAYQGAGKPGMIAKLRGKTEGVLGVITAEILVKAAAEDKKLDGGDAIKQCWSEKILELHIDMPIIQALQEINRKQPDAVIVRDSDGSFHGFLSSNDFRGAMELLGEPDLGGDGKPTAQPEEEEGGILSAVGNVIEGAVDVATGVVEDVASMLTKAVEAAGLVSPKAAAAAKAAKAAKKVVHGVGDTLHDIVFKAGEEDDTMIKRIARLNLIHPNENYMRVADLLCKGMDGTILVFKHTKGAKNNPLKEGLSSVNDFHGAIDLNSLFEMLADGKAVNSVKAKDETYLKKPLLNMSNISSVAHTLVTSKAVPFAAMLLTDHHDKVLGMLGPSDLRDRVIDEAVKSAMPASASPAIVGAVSSVAKQVDIGSVMKRWQSLDDGQKDSIRRLVTYDKETFSALDIVLGGNLLSGLPMPSAPGEIPIQFTLAEAVADDRFNPENTQKLVNIAAGFGLNDSSNVLELLAAAQSQAMQDGVLDELEKAKIGEMNSIVKSIQEAHMKGVDE
jgi:CBS domain-containing protein